jgi:hypothetical protein
VLFARKHLFTLFGLFGVGGLGLLSLHFAGGPSTPTTSAPAPATVRSESPTTKPKEASPEDGPPSLVVLVVFDQLRGDYLQRWQGLFGDGGFRRLCEEGAWFQNCHYPYSATFTGPGHASLGTGCSPDRHGIIANDWYDAVARKGTYCCAPQRDARLVPAAPEGTPKGLVAVAATPELLLAPTLADALKKYNGQSRVVCLSLKDRSAVLIGGRRPDACYWFDRLGRCVTSSYYRPGLHAWARAFNAERAADRWLGKSWERLRTDLDYEKFSGPDAGPGEGTRTFSSTFPHRIAGKGDGPDPAYYSALTASPFGNDLLLDLAKRAVEGEKLGRRGAPDFLAISFSSTDLVGHIWGPDSQEVLDATLRSDRTVKELLDFLDAQVGKGRYVVALSADHGICRLPEAARARGDAGGRIDPGQLRQSVEAMLDRAYPERARLAPGERWVDGAEGPMLWLNRSLLGRLRLPAERVERAVADWLPGQRGVQAAYTWAQLRAGVPEGDRLGRQVQRSFFPDRSPDVYLVEKPGYFVNRYLTGTTHGTPHPYDTHVPLIFYGHGVRRGVRTERVTPQAAAVGLAAALGLTLPRAEVGVPAGLFESGAP